MTTSRQLLAEQPIEIENSTSAPLEVMIEMNPDRYVLQPEDKMVIHAHPEAGALGLAFFDGGVQIYLGWDSGPTVSINGQIVEPDWETPGPNAAR